MKETEDTIIELATSSEIGTYHPETNQPTFPLRLTVEIPSDYAITSLIVYNPYMAQWENAASLITNPRYAQRQINGITYNSYVKGPADDFTADELTYRYKITITKQ